MKFQNQKNNETETARRKTTSKEEKPENLVPREGLEPSRYHYRWILNPLRLPIPPSWPVKSMLIIQVMAAFARIFEKKAKPPYCSHHFKTDISIYDHDLQT